mmetsp:Transcript_33379/g.94563  ORF Transcript_33379/g.94563 Transcript_33379/m.94563 type:complete len:132 (+) Transcript_33379:621-1016(+)
MLSEGRFSGDTDEGDATTAHCSAPHADDSQQTGPPVEEDEEGLGKAEVGSPPPPAVAQDLSCGCPESTASAGREKAVRQLSWELKPGAAAAAGAAAGPSPEEVRPPALPAVLWPPRKVTARMSMGELPSWW